MPSIPTWVLPQAISNQHETNPFQIVWINSRSVEILPWVLLPRFVEASFLMMRFSKWLCRKRYTEAPRACSPGSAPDGMEPRHCDCH